MVLILLSFSCHADLRYYFKSIKLNQSGLLSFFLSFISLIKYFIRKLYKQAVKAATQNIAQNAENKLYKVTIPWPDPHKVILVKNKKSWRDCTCHNIGVDTCHRLRVKNLLFLGKFNRYSQQFLPWNHLSHISYDLLCLNFMLQL